MINLLWGESAVPSVLLLNQKLSIHLLQKSRAQALKENVVTGQPWLAVPNSLWKTDLDKGLFTPLTSRFLNRNQLEQIRTIVRAVGNSNRATEHASNQAPIWGQEASQFAISDLSDSDLNRFNEQLFAAEQKLVNLRPYYAEYLKKLVQVYIPIERISRPPSDSSSSIASNDHHFGSTDFGMSTLWFKGAIFFSKHLPKDIDQLVENIAHEITHHILIQYQLCDFIIHPDHFLDKAYSGIRDTSRLTIQAFHGAAALTTMADICRATDQSRRHEWLNSLKLKTLQSLVHVPKTELGEHLFQELISAEI